MNWPDHKRFITDVCRHFPSGVPRGRELEHLADCDAPLLVCGEAGGRAENEKGRPFVGAAGHVLDTILSNSHLQRSDLYLTNVVPYQPPHGNDFDSIPSTVIAEGAQVVKKKARVSGSRLIVPLGNNALYALLGRRGIMKWRGSVLGSSSSESMIRSSGRSTAAESS